MAFTCAFSSAYSNAFAICVAEPAATVTPTLRGVPALKPRKRPDVIDVCGAGYVSVLGAGRLAGEACLAGELLQPSEGHGAMVYEGIRILVGAIRSGAESMLVAEASLVVDAAIIIGGAAVLALECASAGIGVIASMIAGTARAETAVRGRGAIRVGAEAAPVLIENDEQVGLWLLWLPSEIDA